jgi:GT2 family glycosyltransferase
MTPRVTIVIPTHNRRAVLERGLESIVAQSYPSSLIEVIVVADGCTDGTEHLTMPPLLQARMIAQPASGAAAARNAGAAVANGDLLLFLDDDVIAWPGLVEAHVHAHASMSPTALVVGYLSANPRNGDPLFRGALRGWWETMFDRMRQAGHRFTYADVLSGNCSIPTRLFQALNGFQEQLHCHEDYEFGLRVLKAGGTIAFAPAAGGSHEEFTDLRRSLRRKRDEGTADVWMARAHPDIWTALPLSRSPASRRSRLLRELALNRRSLGRLFDAAARLSVSLLARARLRVRWAVLRDNLLFYWYWCGVADALKGGSFESFREQVGPRSVRVCELPTVNLRQGLAAAMDELDRLDAPGVVLYYDAVYVGTIAPQPWAEPLRGRHLRHILSTTLHAPLAEALATAEAIAAPHPGLADTARLPVSVSGAASDDDARM